MIRRLASLAVPFMLVWTASGEARMAAHGADMSSDNTGPGAAGYQIPKQAAGGEIKDGGDYPFMRPVEASAVYDGFAVNGPHLLIEDTAFSAPLDISVSKPIVLRGVSVRVPAGSPWTVLVRPGAGPFYFLWSAAGSDAPGKPPASGLDLRADQATVYRSHISGAADGIDISGANITIRETLIDKLRAFEGTHNDAIQLSDTARDVVIQRNKMHNPNPQTSCLYILGRNIRVLSNVLAGGGWTIYGGANNNGHGGEGARKVSVTGNIFGQDYFLKSGQFGAIAYWDSSAASGNFWLFNRFDGGAPVEP